MPEEQPKDDRDDSHYIRDLIYFDFDKTASIFSQADGGLLKEFKSELESKGLVRGDAKAKIAFLEGSVRGESADKTSQIETRSLHHDLLVRTESFLREQGVLTSVEDDLSSPEGDIARIMTHLNGSSYIRSEGFSFFDDYQRMSVLAQRFNEVVDAFQDMSISAFKKTEIFISMTNEFKLRKDQLEAIRDRQVRRSEERKLEEAERTFEQTIRQSSGMDRMDETIIAALKVFFEVFFKDHIHLRLYPFLNAPSFYFLSMLDRNKFVDANIDNTVFSYGTGPNVKLTILGLITSIPREDNVPDFSPLSQAEVRAEGSSLAQGDLGVAMQKMFEGLRPMETLVRFARYPVTTLYPLAVYRTIRTFPPA